MKLHHRWDSIPLQRFVDGSGLNIRNHPDPFQVGSFLGESLEQSPSITLRDKTGSSWNADHTNGIGSKAGDRKSLV